MEAMTRTHDSAFLNQVINHPDVRQFISMGHDGKLDCSALVSDPKNICLVDEYGGFIFIRADNDCYDVHTQFLPEGRGKHALEAARAAAWYMFTSTEALAIRTFVPFDNPRAKALTLKMGFRKLDNANLLGKEGELFLFTLKDWAKSLCLLPHHS